MAAGLATLRELQADPSIYDRLDAYGTALAEGLRGAAAQTGVPITVNQIGSMLTAFFVPEGDIRTYTQAARSDTAAFAAWFQAMLAQGVYWSPSQFESIFISGAHTDTELGATLEAAHHAFKGGSI